MLKNYFKIAIRNLLKNKAFSLINILGLSIGMAACIFILLWVQDELSFDTYHEKADRIYRLITRDQTDAADGSARVGAPWGPAMQQDYPEVADFVRFRYTGRSLVRYDDKTAFEEGGLFADSTIFNIFSFPLLKGNPETALTEPNSIVITEPLAKKYFGDENPIGKRLNFDAEFDLLVTGVMAEVPKNSHFRFNYLISFVTHRAWYVTEWQMRNYHVYLLLEEGVQAAELESKFSGFIDKYLMGDDAPYSHNIHLQPLTGIHLHSKLFREFEANGDITYVYIFSLIALFIMLIACINFMNLSTARSARRAREVGVRKVAGASRWQLIRQFLSESLFLSILALMLAVGIVELLLPVFNDLAAKSLEIDLSGSMFILAALGIIALSVGFISGVYPAFFLSAFQPVAILKSSINIKTSNRSMLRKVLVIGQFTITIALLIGAGIIYQQLDFMKNKKLGFNKEQVVILRMEEDKVSDQYQLIRSELLQQPGVVDVAASSALPGRGDWGMPFLYESEGEQQRFSSRVMIIDENYLQTFEINLKDGRNFSADLASDISGSYLINETAARGFGWENPVGKLIERPTRRGDDGNWVYESGEIVGVVQDFHFRSMHQEISPMIMWFAPESFYFLSIRVQPENIAGTLSGIENTWSKFESLRPFEFFFLDEVFESQYRSEERLGQLFAIFSVLAVFIACLGLFGLVSFMAEQRVKEIGIRKVLGASVAGLFVLLSKEYSKWVILANIIAWPVAYYTMNYWLADFAYRIDIAWWIFPAAGGMAFIIALATVSYQAIRAAVANPVDALRYE